MNNLTTLIPRIWSYIRPYRVRFFSSIFFGIANVGGLALYPFLLGLIINELSANVMDMVNNVPNAGVNFAFVTQYSIYLIIVFIIEVIGQYFSLYLMAGAIQNAMHDLRRDISEKTNRIPVSYFDTNQTGDILSRTTNDVDTISNALQQSVINGFIAVLTIVFSFGMMLYIDWRMTVLVVMAMFLSVLATKFITTRSQPIFDKQQNILGDLFGFTQEQLSGFTEIKAYNRQTQSLEVFKEKNNELYKYGTRSNFLSSILQPISTIIFNLAYVAVVGFGGMGVLMGSFTVGAIQSFLSYISSVTQPINQLTQLVGLIQSAISAGNRIIDYLDEEEEFQRDTDQELPSKVKGHVVFDHVKFGYSNDNLLMDDVSFEVLPGQTAAIVGPTGAGKTTLINLLMRFYDVLDGEIRIDGVNIKDISRHELRQHLGMVLQDAWLFSDTIMENIRFGDLDAAEYQVREAAEIANVDKFIDTLPGAYQMEINDEGTNVSQGQKQLMTIARAVISDPDILILDEATSSVDTRLEHLIQEAMDKVMANRTSFVIAHRLSTIRDADIILVMQNGTIIESGSHDVLMAKNGFYADLYNSQFNKEAPADIHMSF